MQVRKGCRSTIGTLSLIHEKLNDNLIVQTYYEQEVMQSSSHCYPCLFDVEQSIAERHTASHLVIQKTWYSFFVI